MIDPQDQGTQKLQLEQKRGRGRPATGQALSNAARQRAYRERQKTQRNEKESSSEESQALERLAIEHTEFVKRKQKEVEQLKARIRELETQLAQRNDNELMKRVELAEAERDAMGNELAKAKAKLSKARTTKRRYILQWQDPENGTWHDDDTGDYGSKAKANAACKRMNEPGFSISPWRIRERHWV
nr:hypothetical protein [Pseudomonas sp. ALS1279]